MASRGLLGAIKGAAKAFEDEYDRMAEEEKTIRAEQRREAAARRSAEYAEEIRRKGAAHDISVEQGLLQEEMHPDQIRDNWKWDKEYEREEIQHQRDIGRVRGGEDIAIEREVAREMHKAGLWRAGMTEEQAKMEYLLALVEKGKTREQALKVWEDNYSDGRWDKDKQRLREELAIKGEQDVATHTAKAESDLVTDAIDRGMETDEDIRRIELGVDKDPTKPTQAEITTKPFTVDQSRKIFEESALRNGFDFKALRKKESEGYDVWAYVREEGLDDVLRDPENKEFLRNRIALDLHNQFKLRLDGLARSGQITNPQDVQELANKRVAEATTAIMQGLEDYANTLDGPDKPRTQAEANEDASAFLRNLMKAYGDTDPANLSAPLLRTWNIFTAKLKKETGFDVKAN